MKLEKNGHNFEVCNATLEIIKKIITWLVTSKATSLDRISSKCLKDGAEVLALPLCNLSTLLIKQSLFPDQYKIAKLKPLFKKDNQVFSTDSCLVKLTDFIWRRMGKGFHTRIILVDLQKVFDTSDYTVLLQKIKCVSFKEPVIKLFQSYLSNRYCFVALEDVFSDAWRINGQWSMIFFGFQYVVMLRHIGILDILWYLLFVSY